jgi:hypothetical protein
MKIPLKTKNTIWSNHLQSIDNLKNQKSFKNNINLILFNKIKMYAKVFNLSSKILMINHVNGL